MAPRPAPITVYRALDFLLAHGLVHMIDSRNAYVACSHAHEGQPAAIWRPDKILWRFGQAGQLRILATIEPMHLDLGRTFRRG